MHSRTARSKVSSPCATEVGSLPCGGWGGNNERKIVFHVTMVRTYDQRADLLDKLRQQTEEGVITLRVAAAFAPEEAAEAHRRLAAAGTRGRCVIVF